MSDGKNSKRKPARTLTKEVFWGGLKIIRKYLAPHRREVLTLSGFAMISAVAEALVPYLAGRVFDAIIRVASDPLMALGSIAFVISIWYLLKVITDFADWKILNGEDRLRNTLHNEYIAQGFSQLLLMPISFHKTRKHGEVGERIERAAGRLANIVGDILVHLSPRFFSVIVALAVTFFINATLALILLAAVVVYGFILGQSVGNLARLQKRMHRAYSRAYGVAYDLLENIQEIKQAAAERFEARRLDVGFVRVAGRLWRDMNEVFRRLDLLQRVTISFTQLAIFATSVFLVKTRAITPGELVSFNGYAAMLFGPFAALGGQWHTIQNGLVALVQAEKVLGLPTEVYVPRDAIAGRNVRGAVEFQNVSFAHARKNAVLKNVSFSVKPGETVALVGESGVGKTTLVELIMGFHFPDRGRILVDGRDLRRFDLRGWRKKPAVVPQEVSLFNDTIAANIRYGSFGASDDAVKRAAREAHAGEFIESFPKSYKQLVGWRGVKLSTGQKQRVAIARAILRNPAILILDEPTSALDARSEQMLKESLGRLMSGRTTFIIAHRLSTVQHADKIIVLDKGTVAEVGAHAELLERGGIYRRLYDIQFGKAKT